VALARNAYLKAGKKGKAAAKEWLLEIAVMRYDSYLLGGRPRDAERIMRLATTKKNATPAEKARLDKARKEFCLHESII